MAGPRAASPALDQGFQQLFPALARFIARAPNAVLPRLCNACHQLITAPGARPAEWCAALTRLAPSVETTEILLSLGQETTTEDIDQVLEVFPQVVERLRSMSPPWDEFEQGRLASLIPPRTPAPQRG